MAINFCPSLNDCVGTSAGSKPTKFRRSNRDYVYVERRSQSCAHSMGSQPRRKQEAHHNVISFRFCRDQLRVRVASSPSTRASAGCVVALTVERPSRLVAPRRDADHLPSKSGLISHGNTHRTVTFHRFLDCTDITHKWFRPDQRTSFKATSTLFAVFLRISNQILTRWFHISMNTVPSRRYRTKVCAKVKKTVASTRISNHWREHTSQRKTTEHGTRNQTLVSFPKEGCCLKGQAMIQVQGGWTDIASIKWVHLDRSVYIRYIHSTQLDGSGIS